MSKAAIIGGGLAGCECAMALARAGVSVTLFEKKPRSYSEAHASEYLAELVCSNSFRSGERTKAVGVLKDEMRALGSLVLAAAEATRVPAGKALAVDRDRFARLVTERIQGTEGIEVVRREVASLSGPDLEGFDKVVLAAGPLLSGPLAEEVRELGGGGLYFYDAIAPIIDAQSVDESVCFWGSRWRPEESDYLNCPMDEGQYRAFVAELLAADKVQPRDFEKEFHFEGCLPIEEMAERGEMTLAHGPLKPVGFTDPRTGERPFALVQLRAENKARTAFNLVGFQTKLTYPEQKRIFRMIPGLRGAEFMRLGSIHRNTYVDAPEVLGENLELRPAPRVHLAGQITGVEGYVESAACGLWLGMLLGAGFQGADLPAPPLETALGALLGHLRTPAKHFQPSNANFGLMPPLKQRAGKKKRMILYGERAGEYFQRWLAGVRELVPGQVLLEERA